MFIRKAHQIAIFGIVTLAPLRFAVRAPGPGHHSQNPGSGRGLLRGPDPWRRSHSHQHGHQGSDHTPDRQQRKLPVRPVADRHVHRSASREGFATSISPSYSLRINESQRVDFKLPIAGSSSTVEVSIQSASIDTVSSTVGGSVTARPLVDLPLNGRNILDLARLQPGVTDGANPGNGSAGGVSIAGGRTDSVTYLLDGGNNVSLLNNGVVFNPNPDAVEEFRILENNYSAEYGRNGGGVITVVSKGGSSDYHGTAFEFARNPDFNANDFFNKRNGLPRNNLKRHQFGGTFGGQILVPHLAPRVNRNFFFFPTRASV